MSKKIVAITGSPRKNGNSFAMTDAFIQAAEEAGNTVTEFFLDDMDKIYPVYKEADIVVLATPLYYWMISGQLKTAFDRLFAVAECDPNYRNPIKESILVMAAEGHGFAEKN